MIRQFVFILLLTPSLLFSQIEDGIYLTQKTDTTELSIVIATHISIVEFSKDKYFNTRGGVLIEKDGKANVKYLYNDANPTLVDSTENIEIANLQPAKKQDLDGVWKISGRMIDGKFVPINHTGTRQTIKILKDGYFQWIAFDIDKKEFFGTGGGTYTFEDGVYTEDILFFSKDNERVGAQLEFQGKIKNGDWHHSGKSSKGDSIYEVWGSLLF